MSLTKSEWKRIENYVLGDLKQNFFFHIYQIFSKYSDTKYLQDAGETDYYKRQLGEVKKVLNSEDGKNHIYLIAEEMMNNYCEKNDLLKSILYLRLIPPSIIESIHFDATVNYKGTYTRLEQIKSLEKHISPSGENEIN